MQHAREAPVTTTMPSRQAFFLAEPAATTGATDQAPPLPYQGEQLRSKCQIVLDCCEAGARVRRAAGSPNITTVALTDVPPWH
eukprot:7326270-Pyramimonas_sp.AAC.5